MSPDQILAAHRQVAAEFGNQADRVVTEARQRRQYQAQKQSTETRQKQAHEAVTFARDRSFEREAVMDERSIFVDALRRGMGETTYPEVRASFEARIASGEFRLIADEKNGAGRRFTTAATIRAEREIIQTVRDGQSHAPQIMSIEAAVPLTESHARLNAAQKRVIEDVLTSRDRVQGLQGTAGAGKTATLEAIRQGAEQRGYAVEGFAPTSRAARQLREAGILADTLQRFLVHGGDAAGRHLYMVDESSLASTRQMRDFLNKIGPQDKVLLIGDIRQHQGVDAGKPFEQLQQAGMRTARLDRIVRQKDPELLKAVEHLSRHETAAGIGMLQQQGRITEIPDPQQRIETIAKSYAAHSENTLIVSPDNALRRAINQAVRCELQERGMVDKTDHAMRVLTPRNDMTGADREWAARYQPGDVLHYVRGSKELGIARGSYAQVVATNAKENLVTVRKQDRQQVTYAPSRLRGISAYREIEREFAVGDRIQFTAPNRELQVANRDLDTIQHIENGKITVRMDGGNGRTVSFDSDQMRHFDHGYARLLALDEPKYSVEQIAAKCGKHPGYVLSRIRLTELVPAAVEAFSKDEIGVGHALLLAKLQPAQQEEALPHCFREDWNSGKAHRILLPVRHLRQWIEQNVMLILKDAPFSKRDAQLVPAAGSCLDCPKRTGHNKLLFADLASNGDLCSDPACYAAKLEMHVKKTIAAQPKLVQITTAYGKSGSVILTRNQYVEIRSEKPQNKYQREAPEYKTCKHVTDAIVAEGMGKGTLHKVCADPNCAVHHPKQRPSKADAVFKAEQEKRRREEAIANTTGLRVLSAISAAVPVRLMKRDLLFLAERILPMLDERRLEIVARNRSLKKTKDGGSAAKLLSTYVRKAEEGELGRLLVETVILLSSPSQQDAAKVLRDAAERYKVNVDAIVATVKQEFAAKEKAKAAKKAVAREKPKAAKKAKAA